MKKVVSCRVRSGGSIFQPSFKHRWWELELECGHIVERRIRYLPPADGSKPARGYAAQWHGVNPNRVPAQGPSRVKCDVCSKKA